MKKLIYKIAKRIVLKRVETSDELLKPYHLLDKGWVTEFHEDVLKLYYYEPNIKGRDTIWIEFDVDFRWYRVLHGKDKTFVALKSRKEWFDIYYALVAKA